MANYQKVVLQEVTENLDKLRVPLSSSTRQKLQKIYPYYGAQGIVDYVDDYLFDGEYLLVAEDGENLRSQNQNVCTLATGKFWVNNHAHILKEKNGNDLRYLYYLLNLINFRPYVTGSAQPKLTQESLNNIELSIHPPENQKKISSFLTSLDSKISLNNRINAELEALAKTIYDYWFVQFDFPISAALAAEMGKPELEGKPYKSSGGEMVWNEKLKREVPKGWEVKPLGDEIEVQRGISYKSSEIKGGGVPMINLNSFKLDGTYKDSGVKWFSGKYAEKNQIEKGDLLIAATDVTRNADIIGKAILVPNYREGGVFSMDIAKVIPSEKLSGSYLMMLFNTKYYHDYIKHFASGTIVLHLNMNGMKWYKAEIPPRDLIERFDNFYQSIAQRITETTKQNQELASLRDWLLPMLMNGQVTFAKASVTEGEEIGQEEGAERS